MSSCILNSPYYLVPDRCLAIIRLINQVTRTHIEIFYLGEGQNSKLPANGIVGPGRLH
jgi:hypothetical protein